MGLKKKDTGLHDDLEQIFDESRSDRPSILGGARGAASSKSADQGEKPEPRRKRARLTAEERRNLHPVQTYLNDDEWAKLKIKLVTQKMMQEEFLYQAVIKAINED